MRKAEEFWCHNIFLQQQEAFQQAVGSFQEEFCTGRGSLRDQEEYLYIKICDFLTKGLSNHSSKELHKKGTSHNEHVNPSQYYFYGKNHKS